MEVSGLHDDSFAVIFLKKINRELLPLFGLFVTENTKKYPAKKFNY